MGDLICGIALFSSLAVLGAVVWHSIKTCLREIEEIERRYTKEICAICESDSFPELLGATVDGVYRPPRQVDTLCDSCFNSEFIQKRQEV
ncbi:MAG TPA: hypothetical protein VJ742_06720, partial [Nitrososphaera sp.]|nr:hypothetical protein [Nitrososphaera sp.]